MATVKDWKGLVIPLCDTTTSSLVKQHGGRSSEVVTRESTAALPLCQYQPCLVASILGGKWPISARPCEPYLGFRQGDES